MKNTIYCSWNILSLYIIGLYLHKPLIILRAANATFKFTDSHAYLNILIQTNSNYRIKDS